MAKGTFAGHPPIGFISRYPTLNGLEMKSHLRGTRAEAIESS